ncbi:MAG: hypothetical protein RLZZ370_1084 [Bacteroidota bacterium]
MKAKLRKILLGLILGLALSLGLLVVLLRSKPVQFYAAKQVSAFLSKEWNVVVQIGGLETDFFSNFTIENVLVEDRSKDTLFFFRRLHARLSSLNTSAHTLNLNVFECSNGLVNLGIHKEDTGQNINFLIDYFTPKKKRTGPKVIWALRAQQAVLRNMEFRNFDDHEAMPVPGSFDPYHLRFSNISGKLDTFLLYDDSLHFGIKTLSARERSGLLVQDLKAQCRVSYYALDVLGFRLKTAHSILGDTLRFRYQGYNSFSSFSKDVFMNGRLHQANLGLRDLSVFQSQLASRHDALRLGFSFKGRLSSLQFKKLDVRYGRQGLIQGAVSMNGLPDWRNTFIDASIQKWQTDAQDLATFLGGLRLPTNLNSLGNFQFRGAFTGFFNQFTASGALESSLGRVRLEDLNMNFRQGYSQANYEGKIQSERFNLGAFYGLQPALGAVDASIAVRGTGLGKSDFNLTLDGKIPMLEVNGKELKDASVDGVLTPTSFSGKAALHDPILSLDLDGAIRFAGEHPEYRFKTFQLHHANLKALGLDSLESKLSCTGNSDISIGNASELQGQISLNGISWNRNGVNHFIPYAQFTATQSGGARDWTLRSHIGDAGIYGTFGTSSLPTASLALLHELMPDFVHRPADLDTGLNISFYLNLRQTTLVSSLLADDFALGPLMLQGSLAASGNSMHLRTEQPTWFEYQGNKFRNVQLQCDKAANAALRFDIGADQLRHKGSTWFNRLQAKGTLHQGVLPVELHMLDSTGNNNINLACDVYLRSDSIPVDIKSGSLSWFGATWSLDTSGRICYRQEATTFTNFYLGSTRNFIEVNGSLGRAQHHELLASFGNFNISDIQPFLSIAGDSIAASLNGTVSIRAGISDHPNAECNILATGIRYNGIAYGDFRLEASSLDVGKRIWVEGMATRGMLKGATVKGSVGIGGADERLNLDVYIPRETSLDGIKPFTEGVVSIRKGFITAQMRVEGTSSEPLLKGSFELRDVQFMVDYTKVTYNIPALRGKSDRNIFSVIPFHIVDETGRGRAIGQATIKHEFFSKFYIDAEVAGANNLKALNTGAKDNELFYGTGYADGNAKFIGPWDKLDLIFNLKTRKNTLVSIPITETSTTGQVSYVSFRKKYEEELQDAAPQESGNSVNSISVNLEITPEAEVRLIFDEKMGDIMKGNGTGDLRMSLDPSGTFSLFGQFNITGGAYLFTALDLINKKFYVNKGGTITWNGDPYDALINIEAEYRQKISPAPLMSGRNLAQTVSYPVTDVVSKLYLKGKLFQPEIRFDLEFPNLQNATSSTNLSDLNATLQRIRADQDEVARQVFGLLVLGNFIPPSFSLQGTTGTEAAGNTVSGLISNQLNNWLSQFGGKFQLTLNMEALTQGAQSQNRMTVNVKVPLFNDRLMIDGTYDPTLALPNVNVEYSITQDGTFRVKAYSRNANQLYQAPGSSSNLSTNTMGLGLFYRREFERWKFSRKAKTENTAPQ